VVADTMSWPPPLAPSPPHTAGCAVVDTAAGSEMLAVVEATTSRLNYAAIAAHQASCPDVAAQARHSSLRVRAADVGGVQLLCDMFTGTACPLIPTADKKHVFAAFHTLAHPGTQATRRLIAACVVWRGMAADIANWCRDCQECQRGKVTP
jgi:Integrase zinc binding domain